MLHRKVFRDRTYNGEGQQYPRANSTRFGRGAVEGGLDLFFSVCIFVPLGSSFSSILSLRN